MEITSPQEYRCISPGSGGTITFTESDQRCIGTNHCVESVGVYFRIDFQRAFCANISCVRTTGQSAQAVSESEGKRITAQIIEKLWTILELENWNYDHDYFGRGMMIVCQSLMYNEGEQARQCAAWHVLRGLSGFVWACTIRLGRRLRQASRKVCVEHGLLGHNKLIYEMETRQEFRDELRRRAERGRLREKLLGPEHARQVGRFNALRYMATYMEAETDCFGFVVRPLADIDILKVVHEDDRVMCLRTNDPASSGFKPVSELFHVSEWCFLVDQESGTDV